MCQVCGEKGHKSMWKYCAVFNFTIIITILREKIKNTFRRKKGGKEGRKEDGRKEESWQANKEDDMESNIRIYFLWHSQKSSGNENCGV